MKKVNIGNYHPLCRALQKKGYSVRLSQQIVSTIFNSIKEALLRKENVELPIGTFRVEKETRTKQRRVGLNGPEWLFKHKYKILFELAKE